MLNRLISLVLLLLFSNTYTLYGNESLILPKIKPSVFKKIKEEANPKKQFDTQKKINRDNITLPESKPPKNIKKIITTKKLIDKIVTTEKPVVVKKNYK